MIVIFEGPDGSGKSTLARAVQALHPSARYLHASAPERHPLVEYTSPIRRGKDYVLDRWHLGEMIYGPRYRGQAGLTQEQFWAVEQYLDDLGAVVVHCDGSVGGLTKRIRERALKQDDNLDTAQLLSEAQAFRKLMRDTWLPVISSPIEVPLLPEEILEFALEQEKKRAPQAG